MSTNRKQRRTEKSLNRRNKNDLPPDFQFFFQEGLKHHQAGRLPEAEKLYRHVLASYPKHADSLNALGVIAYEAGHYATGIELISQAIRIKNNVYFFYNNLGNAYKGSGNIGEAVSNYRLALRMNPEYYAALTNLGLCLVETGNIEEAISLYQKAINLHPDIAETWNNYGLAEQERGRLEDALTYYNHAIALKPDYAEAHFNKAHILLLKGDFENGWQENEWRWKIKGVRPHGMTKPMWDGQNLSERTILLHCEQGLGDSIQFIRYAPLVKAKGGYVAVQCPAPLIDLFRDMEGIDTIIREGDPLPPHDCHAPLLSLPFLFKTDMEAIPNNSPYLHALSDKIRLWRDKLENCKGVKVGLVWRGNPTHKNDRNRSIDPALFSGIFKDCQTEVISLQKDARPDEITAMDVRVMDAGPQLHDFTDTAALVACLDLIVTVDTSVSHLAGALGKPTWTLLPHIPDWRWLLDRTDTPWYQQMKLFRQTEPKNWSIILENLKQNFMEFNKPLQ